MKTEIKALKEYWFETAFEDMEAEDIKELIEAVNPALLTHLDSKIDAAFEIKEENETKFRRKIDRVYDNVIFFYNLPKYMRGEMYINKKSEDEDNN